MPDCCSYAGKKSPRFNLIILAIAFLFIFATYGALEAVQSSLNAKIGTLSLCAVYVSFMIFSLLLPPLVVDYLGNKKSMIVSGVTYVIYTAANFYPFAWSLIPAGILVGAGASVLWVAQRLYVTNLALYVSCGRHKDAEHRVGFFHGMFHTVLSFNGCGAIIMSILLSQPRQSDYTATITHNITSTTAFPKQYEDITSPQLLSLHNTSNDICGNPASQKWKKVESSDIDLEEGIDARVDDTMLRVALLSYIGLVVIGILLLIFGLEDDSSFKLGEQAVVRQLQEIDEQITVPRQSKSKAKKSKKAMILATMRIMATNRKMALLLPSAIHNGIIQVLPFTYYMRFWVTCSIGVGYVGYTTLVLIVTSAPVSFITGRLMKYVSRKILYIFCCALELACLTVLLFWTPTKENNTEQQHYSIYPYGRLVGSSKNGSRMHRSNSVQYFLQ